MRFVESKGGCLNDTLRTGEFHEPGLLYLSAQFLHGFVVSANLHKASWRFYQDKMAVSAKYPKRTARENVNSSWLAKCSALSSSALGLADSLTRSQELRERRPAPRRTPPPPRSDLVGGSFGNSDTLASCAIAWNPYVSPSLYYYHDCTQPQMYIVMHELKQFVVCLVMPLNHREPSMTPYSPP